MKAHATGITLALALALAVGLSFAPIPEAFRPIPDLTSTRPTELVARMLVPARYGPVRAQDAVTAAPGSSLSWSLTGSGSGASSELPAEDAPPHDPFAGLPPVGDERLLVGLPAWEIHRARALDHWAERAGAHHVEIEEGCRETRSDGTCARKALDPWFEDVEPLRLGFGEKPVRVLHLGDSQIASDHITDLIRRRLELRYGFGGRGFLFVDRPTRFAGRKNRTGEATPNWEIAKITDGKREGVFGFSGVRFASPGTGESSTFELSRARVADVAFVTSPNGGALDLFADDRPLSRILTRLDGRVLAFSRVRVPDGAKALTISAQPGGEVELLGVTLETGGAGIVYDTIGLPGAQYEVFLRPPESPFSSQLDRRDPSLVVLMLGGNESYEIGRGWQRPDDVRAHAEKLVARIRTSAPRASCLVLSPLAAGTRSVNGEIAARPHNAEVGAIAREVALANGCAFWNALEAMGGESAAARWYALDLLHNDLVHPRSRGADILGHLLETALESARQSRPGMLVSRAEAAGVEQIDPALLPFFERLLAAQNKDASARPVVRAVALTGKLGTVPESPAWSVVRGAGSSPKADLLVLTAEVSGDASNAAEVEAIQYAFAAARAASPASACLIVAPPDRLGPLPGGGSAPDEAVTRATASLRDLAERDGCAFWSARGAMGGRGASRRWSTLHPALTTRDGSELTAEGARALGGALADELSSAYRAWVDASVARAQASGAPFGGSR